MRVSTKLKLRRTPNKEGKKAIVVQVIIDRKPTEYTTGQSIQESLFDKKKQIVKSRHPHSIRINKEIQDYKNRIDEIIFKLRQKGMPFSKDDIRKELKGNKNKGVQASNHTLVSYLEEYITTNPDDWKHATLVSYKSTLKKLKAYDANTALSKLDSDFVKGYRRYLEQRNLNTNSINKELKNLRRIVNTAISKEYLEGNPFKEIKIGEIVGTKQYLLADEISSFKNVNTENYRESYTKDIFLFGIYTGLRISDILTLKPEHLDFNDKTIRFRKESFKQGANKRGSELSFTLNTKADEILRKYNILDNNKYCFPSLDNLIKHNHTNKSRRISSANAYLNRILGVLIKRAGIKKPITMHCARHTYATIMVSKGGDIHVIGRAMGHKKISTTQIYADVIDKKKDELQSLMDDI